jgi:hypothetical protein
VEIGLQTTTNKAIRETTTAVLGNTVGFGLRRGLGVQTLFHKQLSGAGSVGTDGRKCCGPICVLLEQNKTRIRYSIFDIAVLLRRLDIAVLVQVLLHKRVHLEFIEWLTGFRERRLYCLREPSAVGAKLV